MKKSVPVLLILLLTVNYLQAQPTEKMTNSILLRMVQAKLSDELIIGEINSSAVNFNVSPDSISYLAARNVSSPVLQAMKAAQERQASPTPVESTAVEPEKPAIPERKPTIQPATVQASDSIQLPDDEPTATPQKEALAQPENTSPSTAAIPFKTNPSKSATEPAARKTAKEITPLRRVESLKNQSAFSVDAMGYTIPMTELMVFFDHEFNSLTSTIEGWDQQIRNSLDKGRQINQQLLDVGTQLSDKINANTNGFSNEIVVLKKQLSDQRISYKQYKTNLFTEGMTITKKLKDMGNELDRSIGAKFAAVGNVVRSTNPDPASEMSQPFSIDKLPIGAEFTPYIAPATQLLFFCQNEIGSIRDLIELKNEDIREIHQKDAALTLRLEPLKKELTNLQVNAKKNKKEISALKKQCAELEKEKKSLSQQAEKNSKELAKTLEVMCNAVQGSVNQRVAEIIDQVNYLYTDHLAEI